MRSKHSPPRSPSRRHKQRPPAELRWKTGRLKIGRQNSILQDPQSTARQKAAAQLQIAECQESAATTPAPSADWLRQMDLLAE